MRTPDAETSDAMPVELAAILWADAYRETLRPLLEGAVSADELAVMDRAIDRIERRIIQGTRNHILIA